MFRRFTFRQVALTGTTLAFVGIFMSAFCTTFWQYIFCLSAVYGIGLGLAMAATSLAVNTYFKQKRRRATGFSWTITGLGPIFFPQVSTFLLDYYGAQGSILIYAGIGLNAVLCALTLQPVLWHVKKPEKPVVVAVEGVFETEKLQPELLEANGNLLAPSNDPWKDYECKYCQYQKRAKRGIFSSQYLFNVDDPERPGYEITEPGTPMLARANDGWFGSKISLTSENTGGARYRTRQALMRQVSSRSRENLDRMEQNKDDQGAENLSAAPLYKPNYFNREREDMDRYASKTSVYSRPGQEELLRCTCAEDKALLQKTAESLQVDLLNHLADDIAEEEAKKRMTFFQKVSTLV